MDEEEEQPRRSKKGKKDKKKRAQQDDSDGEAEEEEEDVPIPEISDQPLDRNQAQKVRGIASDWATLREKLHMPSYTFVREVAASVAEFTEGEKGEKVCKTHGCFRTIAEGGLYTGFGHHRRTHARAARH